MPKGKKPSPKPVKQRKPLGEIAGVIIIAIGIFLLVCVYVKTDTGLLGGALRDVFMGLFGLLTYVVPFLFIVLGILVIAARNKKVNKGKAALIVLLIISILSLTHSIWLDQLDLKDGFFAYVADSYNLGVARSVGAGAVGCLLIYPIHLLIGNIGCLILFVTMLLVSILALTNLSIKKMSQSVAQAGKRTVEKARVSVEERQKRRLYIEDLRENETEDMENDGPELFTAKSFRRKKQQPVSYLDDDDESVDVIRKAETLPMPVAEPYVPEETHEEPRSVTFQHFDAFSHDADDDLDDDTEESEMEETRPVAAPVRKAAPPKPRTVYKMPPVTMLTKAPDKGRSATNMEEQRQNARLLEEVLANFGVEAEVVHIVKGPVVTRYELKPAPGVRVKRIKELESDLAMNLAAKTVKIEAPIPGKAAVGIEVPNSDVSFVHLRTLLESDEFKKAPSPITFALGKDIAGKNYYVDISKMPHILIAGETGAGKSVCINSMLTSILFKATPDDVKLVLIDPKVVELSVFKTIPHLLVPVVTEPKKAAGALNWAVTEMTTRYKMFAEKGARDITRFNDMARTADESTLPRIVVVIDELAELMMSSPREVEDSICRIAQLGRAAGIHLVVATQRPSVNVITGVIKANISSRIAFKVNSGVDSRTILDQNGAEKLLGNGDMLYHPTGAPRPVRLQGCYVGDEDIEAVTQFVSADNETVFDEEVVAGINMTGEDEVPDGEFDELLPRAVEIVLEYGQASISMLQRRLRVGYARAARLVDEMEQRKIVSPFEGSKARQVLITWDGYEEMFGAGGE
jgi:S-DNA-T family DNA segregation ATPase FtsK/SpoIIIE